MAPPRELSAQQERDVALAYFCTLSRQYMTERWNVCERTVYRTARHRSRELADPLLEFYRGRGRSLQNAIHLYLAHDEHQEMERQWLVDIDRDKRVYQSVNIVFVKPRIRELVRRLSLDEKLLLKPGNSYEALLKDVFPEQRNGEAIVAEHFADNLYTQYLSASLSLRKAAQDTFDKLLALIKQGALAITPLKQKVIQEALQTLSPREQQALSLVYGLEQKAMSLHAAGKNISLSSMRVGQIRANVLQQLAHPRNRNLSYITGAVTDAMLEQRLADTQAEAEEREKHAHQPGIGQYADAAASLSSLDSKLSLPVDELEFSTRVRNCMGNAGIHTVGKLVQKTERELLKILNFGRRSLKEVREALAERGLSLGMEVEDGEKYS